MISLAIVGRPNVGKSTLFNRILGKPRAVVHDSPGVTRDWQVYEVEFFQRSLRLYDTPGLEGAWDRLGELTLDGLLWVIDASHGVGAMDLTLLPWLRKQSLPIILVANKCEASKTRQIALDEGSRLGFGAPVMLSALHGYGMEALAIRMDCFKSPAPSNASISIEDHQVTSDESGEKFLDRDSNGEPSKHISTKPHEMPSMVILGRPNVGKSSLTNQVLGFDRMLTGPEAGLTRDAIGTLCQWKERPFRLIDTPGMRKKAAVVSELEQLMCEESYRALVFAHVAVVVVDASEGITRQDLTLIDCVQQEGRAPVIAANKWDCIESKTKFLNGLPMWVKPLPMVFTSCVTGQGIDTLKEVMLESYDQWNQRLPTGPLNRWMAKKIEAHAPPMIKGKRIKIKYITQVKSRPPTFIIFGRSVEDLPSEYRRYLMSGLAKTFSIAAPRLLFQSAPSRY